MSKRAVRRGPPVTAVTPGRTRAAPCRSQRARVTNGIALVAWLCGAQAVAQPTDATQATAAGPYRVVADSIPEPLSDALPDPARGRAIVASRQTGLCLLCHAAPIAEERFQGNIAPDLKGAGSRWSAGQLRLRLADPRRLNPASVMPAYYRIDGLTRVAPAWKDKPVLNATQLEDVIAYLRTLRD